MERKPDENREKRHRRDEKDHKERKLHESKHRDKRRRTVSPPPKPIETDLYRLDTKGDSANITYGTSYRYSVPTFHRFGAGFVLGLSSKWRIDRERGEGKGLVVGIRGYDADKRRRGGNMFAVDAARVGRLKAVEGVVKGFSPDDEFVPISGRADVVIEEQPTKDYRSIEGKATSAIAEDIELVSSEDDDETFSYSEELRQRTIDLDRKMQSHPHDIQAWLDYVALQDEISSGQKASTAEIKVGILQKALDKNPGNTKLMVEMFKIASLIWEYDFFFKTLLMIDQRKYKQNGRKD